MKIQRALSVRQPFAERILNGKKKTERRNIPTHIRERVYIYAGRKAADGYDPGDLPTGVLVGTVEIVGCTKKGHKDYRWHLASPKRLSKRLKPRNKPQPVWFRPF